MTRILLFICAAIYGAPALAADWHAPATIEVAAGPFLMGSNRSEKEYGYQLDELAYGHSVTRKNEWYEDEVEKRPVTLPLFRITKTPITNEEYAAFIAETGHEAPGVRPDIWKSYGLIHPYKRTLKFQWKDNKPPKDHLDHPVVLVSHKSAEAYARWLSEKSGTIWRLPSATEWEKAARGPDGYVFPWGNKFDAAKLNSHDQGPFETVAVGQYPEGASPYGLLDAAGQVFEWTATESRKDRFVVKGGSWDDKGCGVCRPAAWHTRPVDLKHILVGFRLVKEE